VVSRWTRTFVTERAVHIVGRLYLMIVTLTKIDESSQCKHNMKTVEVASMFYTLR